MTGKADELDPRLQALLDREEIRHAIANYSRAVDRCDVALLTSVYHPDVVDDHHGTRYTGHSAANLQIDSMLENMEMTSSHITTQTIDVRGDSAGAESSYIGLHRAELGGTRRRIFTCGRYLDRFEHSNDEWRLVQRSVVVEMCRLMPLDEEIDVGSSGATRGRDDLSYQVLGT